MKKLIYILCPLIMIINSSFAYIDKDRAVIVIMDKVAGKTKKTSIAINQKTYVDNLSVVIKSCKESDPFEALNFFAFVEMYNQDKNKIFSGWMNRNEPGYNPMQHPTYDVWLEKCE